MDYRFALVKYQKTKPRTIIATRTTPAIVIIPDTPSFLILASCEVAPYALFPTEINIPYTTAIRHPKKISPVTSHIPFFTLSGRPLKVETGLPIKSFADVIFETADTGSANTENASIANRTIYFILILITIMLIMN